MYFIFFFFFFKQKTAYEMLSGDCSSDVCSSDLEVDHVFFIAAGAYTAHPGELFGHERWKKLHGGFRVEGALLLLYLSAGGLARLSALPDGLIVLSPEGFEPESSIGLGITATVERGIPLVGVVREHWTPAPGPAGDAREAAIPPRPSRPCCC